MQYFAKIEKSCRITSIYSVELAASNCKLLALLPQ